LITIVLLQSISSGLFI